MDGVGLQWMVSVKAALMLRSGCSLGIAPHVAAAMLGLAAVLHASAVAFAAVKYAGVAYLMFMAWNALREGGSLRVDGAPSRRPDLRIVVDAIAVNLLNPKLSIFFVAFVPQFVGADEAHPLLRMGELSAAFMAATFVVFALYGVFAATARRHVLERPRVLACLRRSFAAAFSALAVRLAFAER
jgi:threonine/homoserine/homoserine lactone efflux protein